MPRRPIGDKAMTATERQQRRRKRIAAYNAHLTGERLFRHDLMRFIEGWRLSHHDIDINIIGHAMEKYYDAVLIDEYLKQRQEPSRDCLGRYMRADPADAMFHLHGVDFLEARRIEHEALGPEPS